MLSALKKALVGPGQSPAMPTGQPYQAAPAPARPGSLSDDRRNGTQQQQQPQQSQPMQQQPDRSSRHIDSATSDVLRGQSTASGAPVLPLRGIGGAGLPGCALPSLIPHLASLGMTAVRTWGTDQLSEQFLDTCLRHGIVVLAGIWVDVPAPGHEHGRLLGHRHGHSEFHACVDAAAKQVAQWGHHPAIGMWIVGNECETRCAAGAAHALRCVDACAAAIKAADPSVDRRPVATAVSDRPDVIAAFATGQYSHIDVLGVNSYSGAATLGARLSSAGVHGPWALLEYGGRGPWEVGKAPWGAPLEPTSTQQADALVRQWAGAVDATAAPRLVQGMARETLHRGLTSAAWSPEVTAAGTIGSPKQQQTAGYATVLARRAALKATIQACGRVSSPVCVASISFLAGSKAEGTLTWFGHALPAGMCNGGNGNGSNDAMPYVLVADKAWALARLWASPLAPAWPDLRAMCRDMAADGVPHVTSLKLTHGQGNGTGSDWLELQPAATFTATVRVLPLEPPGQTAAAPSWTVVWSIRQDDRDAMEECARKAKVPGGELTSTSELPREWSRATTIAQAEAGSDGWATLSTTLAAPPRTGAYRLYAFVSMGPSLRARSASEPARTRGSSLEARRQSAAQLQPQAGPELFSTPAAGVAQGPAGTWQGVAVASAPLFVS